MNFRERAKSAASFFTFLLVLFFSACAEEVAEPTVIFLGPTPVGEGEVRELAFETIDRSDWTGDFWQIQEPGLQMIVAPEDAQHLNEFLAKDIRDKLLALDYDTHFAVGVFLGHFNSDSGQEVTVEQVVRRDSQVALYARVPGRAEIGLDAEISPYHLITIFKQGEWSRETGFALYLNGQAVVTETHFIP